MQGLPERPFKPARPERRFGSLKGRLVVPDDFDDPLPDEVLEQFEQDNLRL